MRLLGVLAFTLSLLGCPSSSSVDDQQWSIAIEACARVSSCATDASFSVRHCLNGVGSASQGGLGGLAGLAEPSPSDPAFDCAADAGSCDEAGRCINGGEPAFSCTESRCDGDVLHSCISGVSFAVDCAESGQQCLAAGGVFTCGASAECETRTSECRGGRPHICFDDVETSRDCSNTCLDIDGEAVCVDTTTPTCDAATAAPRCDGDVAIGCRFGYETLVVCSAGACRVTSDGAICDTPRPCGFTGASCEGTVLRHCLADGRQFDVDCADVGARTCEALAFGARCVR